MSKKNVDRNGKPITTLKNIPKEGEEGWVSIPELRDYLVKEYKTTPKGGKEINIFYTHYLIDRRQLPFDWGGNVIEVGKIRGLVFARILEQKVEKKKPTGRPKGRVSMNRNKGKVHI